MKKIVALLVLSLQLFIFIPSGHSSDGRSPYDSAGQTAARAVLLSCGRFYDVENKQVHLNRQILIENGRITAIGRSIDAPKDTLKIDLKDQSCLPGLMDMHVHLVLETTKGIMDYLGKTQSSAYNALRGLKQAQTLLDIGFTTIRVPGTLASHYYAVELREAINRGDFIGPRMIVAPHALSPIGGHGDFNSYAPDTAVLLGNNIVDGPDAIRAKVREQIKFGADWIKVMASGGVMSQHDDPNVAAYTAEEFHAFASEVHRHNKKITAHAHGDAGIRAAVEAGFDSIEHGTMMSEDTARLMAEKGTYWIPTFFVLDWILEMGRKQGITKNNLSKAQLVGTRHNQSMEYALKHGVKIVLGSDPIFPMELAIKEFAAMDKRIPDKWIILKAGTITAAEMLGMDKELGSLSVGKLADIVAMPGDPLTNMSAIENVTFVMKGGEIIRHDMKQSE